MSCSKCAVNAMEPSLFLKSAVHASWQHLHDRHANLTTGTTVYEALNRIGTTFEQKPLDKGSPYISPASVLYTFDGQSTCCSNPIVSMLHGLICQQLRACQHWVGRVAAVIKLDWNNICIALHPCVAQNTGDRWHAWTPTLSNAHLHVRGANVHARMMWMPQARHTMQRLSLVPKGGRVLVPSVTPAGKPRRWDIVETHPSVGVVLFHKTLQASRVPSKHGSLVSSASAFQHSCLDQLPCSSRASAHSRMANQRIKICSAGCARGQLMLRCTCCTALLCRVHTFVCMMYESALLPISGIPHRAPVPASCVCDRPTQCSSCGAAAARPIPRWE